MKRSVLLRLGFVLPLLAAGVAPACSSPGDESPAATSEDAYTTQGLCDGLPRVKNLQTPPGVCVGVVTTGIKFARGIAQLETGDFIVAEMGGWAKDRGGVWLLRRNPDRTFSRTKLNSSIDKPSGVAIGPDQLAYIGTPDAIYRFDPYAATLKSDPTKTLAKSGPLAGRDAYKQPPLKLVVANLPGDISPNGKSGARHPLKHFVFDKHEPFTMYVNIGSASDTCEQGPGVRPPSGYPNPCPEAEGASARGSIRKYVLEGPEHLEAGFKTIARGLRNSMALAVHPTSNLLIQGENSRDSIDKLDASFADREGDLPHDELNVVLEGAHYGWPYCFDNGTPNPEYRGRLDCNNFKNPALLLPGHVAPLGMQFYTGAMFPAAYQNQLIVTFHGYREHGHRLMMVPVDANGIPGAGEPLDIIRGWDKSGDGRDPLGAPVDVTVAQDGSLYVTEDKNNDVLRVFFDPSAGDGAPMKPLPVRKATVSADEKARCDALAKRTDAFSRVQRDLIDKSCVGCHGAGPGFPGGLALLKCDAIGNATRLRDIRPDGSAYVSPTDLDSELMLRLRGLGFPQMPAGGSSLEDLGKVETWIREGALIPQ